MVMHGDSEVVTHSASMAPPRHSNHGFLQHWTLNRNNQASGCKGPESSTAISSLTPNSMTSRTIIFDKDGTDESDLAPKAEQRSGE